LASIIKISVIRVKNTKEGFNL